MQFGFKPSYGTRDAIFAQHSIISNSLCKKKNNEVIFCVYRFQKLFDFVDRRKCMLMRKVKKKM